MKIRNPLFLATIASIGLGGCYVEEIQGSRKPNDPATLPEPPAEINHAPTISGSPSPTIVAGEFYEFMPEAADADGDTLEFNIVRKPSWANFNKSTGRLSGTPQDGDVGNFTNIEISVSDGQESRALTAFDITVDAIALGAATLSWNPPTQNVDGSALMDLQGYRIYYGRDPTVLGRSVAITNPGLTSYVIENLQPGVWHFVMTSINVDGVESRRTDPVSKSIS
jgi:putative Ig domain-containing protein